MKASHLHLYKHCHAKVFIPLTFFTLWYLTTTYCSLMYGILQEDKAVYSLNVKGCIVFFSRIFLIKIYLSINATFVKVCWRRLLIKYHKEYSKLFRDKSGKVWSDENEIILFKNDFCMFWSTFRRLYVTENLNCTLSLTHHSPHY